MFYKLRIVRKFGVLGFIPALRPHGKLLDLSRRGPKHDRQPARVRMLFFDRCAMAGRTQDVLKAPIH